MLQDHGRGDTRQSPEHEEDQQAAPNLLQVQELKKSKPKKGSLVGNTNNLCLKIMVLEI